MASGEVNPLTFSAAPRRRTQQKYRLVSPGTIAMLP